MLGGAESHTAIMARSLGIPAVFGVTGLVQGVEHGDVVVVDGIAGKIVVNPTPETARLYETHSVNLAEERTRLARLKDLPGVTRDGMPIALMVNIEMAREIDDALDAGAMGVGLLRTEFMFMNRETVPSEDEQADILSEIVARMRGRPVTIRTLDIGGDKLAPSLREQVGEPAEPGANPALGVRGIRLSLAHERLFENQLAAILRASSEGPVRILLPMITSVEEIRAVQVVLDRVAKRLRRRHAKVRDAMPKLGIMIEVPGAALSADSLAAEADFFAIGTNDLTMYTLAIDRGDERVAPLYNPLHPAVLRLIQFSVEAGLRARVPVSVCGEIAGDPRFAALLLGLGVRELSMTTRSLLRVKRRVRVLNLVEAARRARTIMDQGDGRQIAALLDDFNASCAMLETGEA
jgi:phosphotransferase system enzyme I (PtsI)